MGSGSSSKHKESYENKSHKNEKNNRNLENHRMRVSNEKISTLSLPPFNFGRGNSFFWIIFIETFFEFNRRIRKSKDGCVVDWILQKKGNKCLVQFENGSEKVCNSSEIPSWILYLFDQNITMEGREFEWKEPIQEECEDAEVAEILVYEPSGKYLIRFKGDTMAQAHWYQSSELVGCDGLVSSYWKEVKHGKSLKNMRPTKCWNDAQGAGSRKCSKITRFPTNSIKGDGRNKYTKNKKWYAKRIEKLLYKQSCFYDAFDYAFPGKLPKSCSRLLRNATKKEFPEFEERFREILKKHNTNLYPVFLINKEKCDSTLRNMLRCCNDQLIFVIYRTNLQFHTGLYTYGKVKPYEIKNHSRSKIKIDSVPEYDNQDDFLKALDLVPEKVIAFYLKERLL